MHLTFHFILRCSHTCAFILLIKFALSYCDNKRDPFYTALKVSITVSYTPPDQYPTYSTPNYRAASSVSLRCVVEGATGSVQYRWSSTCRSCFASSGYSSTISEHFLRSKDTGVHTCTVTDAIGNSGTYSEQMNIAGENTACNCHTMY